MKEYYIFTLKKGEKIVVLEIKAGDIHREKYTSMLFRESVIALNGAKKKVYYSTLENPDPCQCLCHLEEHMCADCNGVQHEQKFL